MFSGFFKNTIKGISAPFDSLNVDPFAAISLDIKGNKNIDDSFKSLIEIKQLTGDNQCSCDGYKIDAERYSRIEKAAEVLILQLKRFGYNLKNHQRYNVNDRFEFHTVVDLTKDLVGEIHLSYEFKEAVLHIGNAGGGHYISLVFIDGK
jgi:ubiquitin C-terminal hydrolase